MFKARIHKHITDKRVEVLASYGLSNTEMAIYFECDEGTIRKTYSDSVAKGRNNMKLRLRQAQMKSALGGSYVMQIWLGKNILNQKDKIESRTEFEIIINRKEIDFKNGIMIDKFHEVENEQVDERIS